LHPAARDASTGEQEAFLIRLVLAHGAQVWLTGADPAAFADVAPGAETFDVSPGRATPRRA
jgi:hypothetical protein